MSVARTALVVAAFAASTACGANDGSSPAPGAPPPEPSTPPIEDIGPEPPVAEVLDATLSPGLHVIRVADHSRPRTILEMAPPLAGRWGWTHSNRLLHPADGDFTAISRFSPLTDRSDVIADLMGPLLLGPTSDAAVVRVDQIASLQAEYWLLRPGQRPELLITTGIAAGDSPEYLELEQTLQWSPDGAALLLADRWLSPDIVRNESGAAIAWPFVVLRPDSAPLRGPIASEAAWLDAATVVAVVEGKVRRFVIRDDLIEEPFPTPITATRLSVSPDGSSFAAVLSAPSGVRISVYDAAGAQRLSLQAQDAPLAGPDGLAPVLWSPDSDAIAYRTAPEEVTIADFAGNAFGLTVAPLPAIAWSPDSEDVAVASERHLKVVAVGGTLRAETHLPHRIVGVTWSPAGEHLVASTLDESAGIARQGTLYVLTPALQVTHRLVVHRCSDAEWSPSGAWLAIAFVGCF